MTRIVKNPEVRKLEIIKAARKLFEKLGYESTTVEAIIKESGIAKGTFYYYFKSKKEILAALVDQIAFEIEAYFKSIIDQNGINAIQKLELMLRGPQKQAITSSEVMEIIHSPENRELQEKLHVKTIQIIAPMISHVLAVGEKEGTFSQSPSLAHIQVLMAGSQFLLESGLYSWPSRERLAILKSIQNILEWFVGAKSGTLDFVSKL